MTGDDQQLDDVLAQLYEEMKFLEEMVEMDIFLNEYVFFELEDDGFDKEIFELNHTLNFVLKEGETTSSHGDY